MSQNLYAPPKAAVADAAPLADAPALWNPRAAMLWSLLFSPVFGAFLHMKNWRALGEPARAANSQAWFIGSIVATVASMFLALAAPESMVLDLLSRVGGLALLVAWAVASASAQTKYVAGRFGDRYPRRSWLVPLLVAFAILVVFTVIAVALAIEAAEAL